MKEKQQKVNRNGHSSAFFVSSQVDKIEFMKREVLIGKDDCFLLFMMKSM